MHTLKALHKRRPVTQVSHTCVAVIRSQQTSLPLSLIRQTGSLASHSLAGIRQGTPTQPLDHHYETPPENQGTNSDYIIVQKSVSNCFLYSSQWPKGTK